MRRKKRVTIKAIADSMQCPCSICSSQDIKVEDNFEQIGKRNFTKLALSALEISRVHSMKGGEKTWQKS